MTDTEPTIAEVMGEPTKRRRGRPPKTVVVGIEGNEEAKPTRRPRKLTSDDVEQMVVAGFDLVAMVRGPHWKVGTEEVSPWSKNAADLLNAIPSKYGKAFIQLNGYAMVAVGLYAIVVPRVSIDRTIRKQTEAVQNGTISAEDANAVLAEEYARWTGPKAN